MKMFLTRLGFGSKIVVTGDITQVDLPGGTTQRPAGGPGDPRRRRGRALRQLTSADVVRHRLVGDIVDAYARWDAEQEQRPAGRARRAGPRRARRPRRPPALTHRGEAHDVHRDRQRVRRRASTPTPILAVARHALDEMGVNPLAELSILLVDVDYMTELNHRWMGGDGPTDVLAFPMDEGSVDHGPGEAGGGEPALLGDIVLCPEVAAKQAAAAGHTRRRRAAPAHRARRAAPARLRPRRAGGGAGDVRAAGPAARQLAARRAG